MILIRFFLAFFLLFSSPLFADSNDLIITQPGDIFTDFTVEMYEDSSASMSFAEIQSLKNFNPHNNHISTGYSKSVFWFRFTLINKTDTDLTYFAKFTENFAHKVHGFITSKQSSTVIQSQQGVAYLDSKNSGKLLKVHHSKSTSKAANLRLCILIFLGCMLTTPPLILLMHPPLPSTS